MAPAAATKDRGILEGYRSGLEERIAEQLRKAGVLYEYETHAIAFVQPVKRRTYRPDFILPNGIVVETKGVFTTADRQKHLFVKADHPALDIRFVFSNSRSKIGKGSPTSYAMWCDYNAFVHADKWIPQAWLDEPPRLERMIAAKAAMPSWHPPVWPA